MKFKTEQEEFWAGNFGNEYVDRVNENVKRIASNIHLFSNILRKTSNIHSVIEFGANIGLNLKAINKLLPEAVLSAIEINAKAINLLKKWKKVKYLYEMSLFDFNPDTKRDFVLTKGVLIHINPEMLKNVYELLYNTSNRYICIAEYYNPTPVSITYRGNENKLFKRDFAGEFLDKYEDFKLIDYGFQYRKDINFPQDDITWFLLKKIDGDI
jgi:spore coat polysaccharide biosynthesis protein SpsF